MDSLTSLVSVTCPRCKSTSFAEPSLKLMVNTCGHRICNKCVEVLFSRISSPCYQCQVLLNRNNFKDSFFLDDDEMERDLQVRRELRK
ncbi:MAG: CDK-activating kinase assembly factor MAT1, partial [Paramarteilia canceri]